MSREAEDFNRRLLRARDAMDRKAARATRERILAEAAANGTTLFPAHFCAPFCGRVVKNGSNYGLVDLNGEPW